MTSTALHTLPVASVLDRVVGLHAAARRNAKDAALYLREAGRERRALTEQLERTQEPTTWTRLSRSEALELLGTATVGRLAFTTRVDVPDIVPVNVVVDGDEVLVVSDRGPKLAAAERRASVASRLTTSTCSAVRGEASPRPGTLRCSAVPARTPVGAATSVGARSAAARDPHPRRARRGSPARPDQC